MRTAQRALHNSVFNLLGLAAQYGSSVLVAAMIARSLGPHATGIYNAGLFFATTLLTAGNLGVPHSLTRFIATHQADADPAGAAAIARHAIKLQFVVIAAAGAAGAGLAAFFAPPEYRWPLVVAAMFAAGIATRDSGYYALSGYQRYAAIARLNIIGAALSVAAVATAAILGATATIMVMVNGGVACIVAALVLATMRQKQPPPRQLEPQERDAFWRFARPAAVLALVGLVLWQRSELWFLEHYVSAKQVAFYSLAFSLVSKLEDLASSITDTLLPISSEAISLTGVETAAAYYSRAQRYLQMAIVPLCVGGILLARPIVHMLFGPPFAEVALPLQVLLGGMLVAHMVSPATALLYATGKHWYLAWLWIPAALLNLEFAWLWARHFAAPGAALAKAAAQIVATVAALLLVRKAAPARFPWRATFLLYASVAVSFVPFAAALRDGARGPLVLAAAAASTAIYVTVLWGSGQFRREDAEMFRNVFGRLAGAVFSERK